jgi:hypothetical protein
LTYQNRLQCYILYSELNHHHPKTRLFQDHPRSVIPGVTLCFKRSEYGRILVTYARVKVLVCNKCSHVRSADIMRAYILMVYSLDGHHKTVVEHTLNVLFLPGIHTDRQNPSAPQPTHNPSPYDSPSSSADLILPVGSPASLRQPNHPADPGLSLPGTSLSLPSPLHVQLHVTTRLSFNEQGRITHHRDIWDVKDVLGLVPGLSLAQWITSRLAARSLGFAARLFLGNNSSSSYFGTANNLRSRSGSGVESATLGYHVAGSPDLESSRGPVRPPAELTPAAAYGAYAKGILGLSGMITPRRDV